MRRQSEWALLLKNLAAIAESEKAAELRRAKRIEERTKGTQ